MANDENVKPKIGERVTLVAVPPGLLHDLPDDDQRAISEPVGKTAILNGYDEDGRAELQLTDANADFRFVYVRPEFIRSAE